MYLGVLGLVVGTFGSWYRLSHAVQSWGVGGAGSWCIVGEQVMFCIDVVASVTLVSVDGVVLTVSALYLV
jgi:hypothetical protein